MTCVVNVLTPGFVSLNGKAFLYPLLRNRERLRDREVELRLFRRLDSALYDCDVLAIDSKYYRYRWHQEEDVLAEFSRFQERAGAVLFFDTGDSTGLLVTQVLPYVRGYFKNQLCKDRSLYKKPMYGGRIYTDYYHHRCSVTDEREILSKPVSDEHLSKLNVSWNIATLHYGMTGQLWMAAFERVERPLFLRAPRRWTPPSVERPKDLSCRMTIDYERRSVAYQRQTIAQKLPCDSAGGRVSRAAYLRELRNARVVVSPFGWGEINTKDFESFICGALLLKPCMEHLETYPSLFREQETIVAHPWDLSDVNERVQAIIDDYPSHVELAREGQYRYRSFLTSASDRDRWADRFCSMVQD